MVERDRWVNEDKMNRWAETDPDAHNDALEGRRGKKEWREAWLGSV